MPALRQTAVVAAKAAEEAGQGATSCFRICNAATSFAVMAEEAVTVVATTAAGSAGPLTTVVGPHGEAVFNSSSISLLRRFASSVFAFRQTEHW